MWSSIIGYKHVGGTAAVFILWQRRQPGAGVTSTQDVAGVCRGLWGRVAVQGSQQSLFLLPGLSDVRVCVTRVAGRVNEHLVSLWGWCSMCRMLLVCGKLQAALMPNIYFRFLMRWPLKDYLHRSFRGTIKIALPRIIFHFVFVGFVCMPPFLVHAPIWLIIPCMFIRFFQLASLTAAKNLWFQRYLLGTCLFLLTSAAWFNQNPLCPGFSRSLPLGKLLFSTSW